MRGALMLKARIWTPRHGHMTRQPENRHPQAPHPQAPHPQTRHSQDHAAEEEAARRDLARLRREGEGLFGLFGRLLPPPVHSDDPVEIWATRIGRSLSLVAIAAICLYLLWLFWR